jgi:hypothetical protein
MNLSWYEIDTKYKDLSLDEYFRLTGFNKVIKKYYRKKNKKLKLKLKRRSEKLFNKHKEMYYSDDTSDNQDNRELELFERYYQFKESQPNNKYYYENIFIKIYIIILISIIITRLGLFFI